MEGSFVGSYAVTPAFDTPVGHALAFSEPVVVSDYSQPIDYRYPDLLKEHGCVASANVPVRTQEGVFGVLEVDHVAPHEFSSDDIYFLAALGNTIAQAIELRRSFIALNRTLEEKQLFAREMNHRIKNNLSLVGAILSLHSRRVPDLAARDELQNAIQRINNLALVHDRLQMFAQLDAQIDAQAHFEEVAAMLRSLLPSSVRLTTECSGSLPGDCIESLTLIANELITNAAKYAFESRDTGEIVIGFRQEGPGWRFWVQDDGIGASERNDAKQSFGSHLIAALAARINAALYRSTVNGTRVEITFGVPLPTGAA